MVASLVGYTASAITVQYGHIVALIANAVILFGLWCFTVYTIPRRYGSLWEVYGPTLLMTVSIGLIMVQPVVKVEEDYGRELFPHEYIVRLFTFGGFFLMILATMWNVNMWDKILDCHSHWRTIRGGDEDDGSL